MEGGAEKAFLDLTLVSGIFHRPVAQQGAVFAHDAVTATGGVDQDAVEVVVEVAGQYGARGLAGDGVGDAAALQVTDEGGDALIARLVGD